MLLAWMQAAASRAPPQHPLVGRWVHERELPLWLIKAFEEKSRREAAVEAARAAREAAREAARGQATRCQQAFVLASMFGFFRSFCPPLSGLQLMPDVIWRNAHRCIDTVLH